MKPARPPQAPRRTRRAGRRDLARTASAEDYLERIDALIERTGCARVVDIAASLAVSRPSVTAMVQRLAEAGYLNYAPYRGLVMTARGRAIAQEIKSRHATLKRFLSLLGVDEATQETDIESWEHCLSPATLQCLARLADYLEVNPTVLRAFRQQRRAQTKPHRSAAGD
jgi:DtxR family Mn-dependent transcriptional regulator